MPSKNPAVALKRAFEKVWEIDKEMQSGKIGYGPENSTWSRRYAKACNEARELQRQYDAK